jgi:hypothetical protein
MGASNYVDLDVDEILRETDAAFLLRLADSHEELWLPKSQVADPDDYAVGDEGLTISITEFIAREKGLLE